MCDLELLPPHSSENSEIEKDETDTEDQYHLEETKTDNDKRVRLISNHPTPYYQGPFLKPLGTRTLDQTFADYTTFTHSPLGECGVWIADKNVTSAESSESTIRKHIRSQVNSTNSSLFGPASNLDGSIIYSCEYKKCKIDCLCCLCTTPSNCDLQCKEHKIGLSRTFSDHEDSFTLVAQKGEMSADKLILKKESCTYKKYAGIPKHCEHCKKDLKNHQMYHKVFHHRCKFCKYDFRLLDDCVTLIDVKKQIDYIHSQEEETCSSCFKVFSNKSHRKVHEENAHSGKIFTCSVCSRNLQSEKSLKYHVDTYHKPDISGFECSVCSKILSTKQILDRHVTTLHTDSNLTCEKCGEKFSRRNNYHRHLQEVHAIKNRVNFDFVIPEKVYKYKCDQCEKQFIRKEHLRRHEESAHGTKADVYTCDLCTKKFNRKDNRDRHKKICSSSVGLVHSLLLDVLENVINVV